MRRFAVFATILLLLVLIGILAWRLEKNSCPASPANSAPANPTPATLSHSASGATNVYAHNLMLRKGPDFRVYVRWLRGQMRRTHPNQNPSFDDATTFYLYIQDGILRANIGDIANFLNSELPASSPLKGIKLSGNADQLKLNATYHKLVSIPIEIAAQITFTSAGQIRLHVNKIDVLHVPFKGLLGGFHVQVSDLFKPNTPGLSVSGNDIVIDSESLLPPPHIHGNLKQVHIVNPDLEEVYGDVQNDLTRVANWRNFIRLSGGSIDVGKLTMHQVDMIMIDISNDYWFNIDLEHIQDQLVNGTTRMTPEAGLQIFMPDLRQLPPQQKPQDVSIEWMKHRDVPPPADVLPKELQK